MLERRPSRHASRSTVARLCRPSPSSESGTDTHRPALALRRVVVFLLLATTMFPGCFFALNCDGGDELSDEDLEGAAYEVGADTKARYGKSKKPKKATIHAMYGRLAAVDFKSSRTRRWVDVKDLKPEGRAVPLSDDDECDFDEDDTVTAIWSRSGRLMSGKVLSSRKPGKVLKPYGKMAQVEFKDGFVDWVWCKDMKEHEPVEEDDDDDDDEKDKSSSDNDVCAFRPSKGKYVACQTFTHGKCIAGARACKPRGKCVYRPEKGKYVRCSTFSNGKCRGGSAKCKPSSKCVFSKKKGKYVKCTSFVGGECKSGSRACTPPG